MFVPALLLLALAALVLTALLSQLFSLTGAYRLVAYRPLVDLSIFLLLLGLLAALSTSFGLHA